MRLLDPLYEVEIYFLHVLQQLPCFSGPWENFWLAVTKIGDPAWTFVVYFPLIFPFRRNLALRFLVAGATSEFLNGIFKWLLHGDRPYWYIKEHQMSISKSSDMFTLKQFQYTCETGPGSPSGHAMVTASVFYVLYRFCAERMEGQGKNGQRKLCNQMLYICLLVLVSISRLYIAAHFPHQVALGIFCGVVVGHLCSKLRPGEWKLREPLSLASGLLVFGVGAYAILYFQGYDPNWSIEKAVKHCDRTEDIAWLLSLCLIGKFGIGIRECDDWRFSRKVLLSFLCLAIAQCLFRLPLPQSVIYYYYGLTLVLHMSAGLCVIAVLPLCLSEGSQQLFLSSGSKPRAESSCANKNL